MLSVPRDLFVTRCDGTRGRINGAYTSGGPTCLAETVGRLTGIALDDYIEVNLFGFSRIVDAAGGVPIYLDRPLVDRAAGVELPAGWVVLDGRSALGYVRARNVDGNADLGRIMRQQHFLKALGHKVISPNTLVNAPRLFRMAAAAGSSLTADQGLGPMDLMRIMRGARGLAGGRLAVYTVPAHPRRIGGADVLVPDKKAAEALFAQFRDGSILRGT
jgi:LCP family protein required for cell wall assembly